MASKPGPKPTPTPLLRMRGSRRGRERPDDPKPGANLPACPEHLDAEARAYWGEVVPKLDAMGILGDVDLDALVVLCTTWVQYRRDVAECSLKGRDYEVVLQTGEKVLRERPASKRIKQALIELNRLWALFGMSPADRVALGRVAQPLGGGRGAPQNEEGGGESRFFAG